MAIEHTDDEQVPSEKTRRGFAELKDRVHRQLLERIDLVALGSLGSAEAEDQVRSALHHVLQSESDSLSGAERDQLIDEVGYEVLGLGPLDPLLPDGEGTDT